MKAIALILTVGVCLGYGVADLSSAAFDETSVDVALIQPATQSVGR